MSNLGVVVVSSEEDTQKSVAELLAQCGLQTRVASTIKETQGILGDDHMCVVVCAEELPDGDFHDVVRLSRGLTGKVPVVVFSHLADWNRYLKIMGAGAFDYVLYPSIRGELERVVRNALSYRAERAMGAWAG